MLLTPYKNEEGNKLHRNFTLVLVYKKCIMFDWEKKRMEKSNLDMGVAKELFFCSRKKNGFGEK